MNILKILSFAPAARFLFDPGFTFSKQRSKLKYDKETPKNRFKKFINIKRRIVATFKPYLNFGGNTEEADKFGIKCRVDFDPNYKGQTEK